MLDLGDCCCHSTCNVSVLVSDNGNETADAERGRDSIVSEKHALLCREKNKLGDIFKRFAQVTTQVQC